MAILAQFSACILIDGKPRKEYPDQNSEEQGEKSLESKWKVIKYIEILTGAHFVIRVQREKTIKFKRANGILFEYFSDGREIVSSVVLKAEFDADEISDVEGKSIGNGSSIRPFKFGDINFSVLGQSTQKYALLRFAIGDTKTTDRAALLEGKHFELATLTIKIWLAKCTNGSDDEFSNLEEDSDAVKGGAVLVRAR